MAELKWSTETVDYLVETMRKEQLSKIAVKNGELELTLERAAVRERVVQTVTDDAANLESLSAAEVQMTGNVVRSPIIGTFYAAPAPDKPPFVTVGQTVKRGEVVCIIESMKLMNEIKSEFDGVVREICVQSGDIVEFNQPILVIG